MGFFSSWFAGRKPADNPVGGVVFDEARVVFRCGGRVEAIAWAELIEVGILTTDEGPLREDVFFMLLGPTQEKGLAIPQGADGTKELLDRLGRLAGFDHAAFIRAMGCATNDRFVCWRRPQA